MWISKVMSLLTNELAGSAEEDGAAGGVSLACNMAYGVVCWFLFFFFSPWYPMTKLERHRLHQPGMGLMLR